MQLTRRRHSIIFDINYLIICNHTDCTVSMEFNMYEQHPQLTNFEGFSSFKTKNKEGKV